MESASVRCSRQKLSSMLAVVAATKSWLARLSRPRVSCVASSQAALVGGSQASPFDERRLDSGALETPAYTDSIQFSMRRFGTRWK
jgi:hypothetical protein